MLAGLISDEDRSSASRIPGLGDLPLLGRLYSNQHDERNKTEIVLLITPRVLRSDGTRHLAQTEYHCGTENDIGGRLSLSFGPALTQDASQANPAAIPDAPPAKTEPQIQLPPAPDKKSCHNVVAVSA